MDRYDHSKIRTKDWVMGNYPMPQRQPLTTLADVVEELREFHHDEAADRIESVMAQIKELLG